MTKTEQKETILDFARTYSVHRHEDYAFAGVYTSRITAERAAQKLRLEHDEEFTVDVSYINDYTSTLYDHELNDRHAPAINHLAFKMFAL